MTDTDISQEHRSEQRLVKSLSTPNFSLSRFVCVSTTNDHGGDKGHISIDRKCIFYIISLANHPMLV